MKIQNLNNSPKVPFELEGYILHSGKRLELIHLVLKPGENLSEHTNPFDVIFFVAEGKGILSIEGEEVELITNDTIQVSSDKKRGWENNSNKNLRLLVMKLL